MKRWKWLAAGLLSVSLLGACGTDEEPQDDQNMEEQENMNEGDEQDKEMEE